MRTKYIDKRAMSERAQAPLDKMNEYRIGKNRK